MNDWLAEEQRQEHRRLMTWRHDVMPQEPDPTLAPLDGLPPIDWASAGITDWQKPKPVELDIPKKDWKASMPLPRADVVVMTWTVAEWVALDHVFCDYDRKMSAKEVKDSPTPWRDPWYNYSRNYYTIHQYLESVKRTGQGGAPSLYNKAWGRFRMVEVTGQQVLLIKSDMHLA